MLLIFFHSACPFTTHSWHINNAETSDGLTYLMGFFHNWRMPLLFMVSGAGVWFAINNKTGGQFFKERCKRLLLPLAFGLLVIVPPQLYLERLSLGESFDSYLDFYPHVFDAYNPAHLWFILSLFLYCIVLLPLFLFLKSDKGTTVVDKTAGLLSRRWGIFLLVVPVFLTALFLNPFNIKGLFQFHYLVLMLIGFVIVSRDSIMQAIANQRKVLLAVAVIGVSFDMYVKYAPIDLGREVRHLLIFTAYVSLLLTILGYGKHYLNFSNAFLRYTNEAVYPFYIIHQTITVILAYYIVQWDINLWVKLLLTTGGTVIFTLSIYHFGIRPFNMLRPLFGLKTLEAKPESFEGAPVKVS